MLPLESPKQVKSVGVNVKLIGFIGETTMQVSFVQRFASVIVTQ